MKRKASRNFQNNNKALCPSLSTKKALRIGIIAFCVLFCFSIFPKNIFAQLVVADGFAGNGGGQGFTGGGQQSGGETPTARTPLVPEGLGQGQVPTSPSMLPALGNAAMGAAQPAIRAGQALYDAGRATYNNTVSPALSRAYQEFGRLATAAQQPPESLRQQVPQITVQVHPVEPLNQQTPGQVARVNPPPSLRQQMPEPLAPIQSLPNNSFARMPENYNMPSLPTTRMSSIPNLNSAFNQPIRIDVPFEIALNKVKYDNIPATNLQIKPLPTIKPITNPAIKTLQAQPFNNLVMPKISPINMAAIKPIANIKPLTMPMPIVNTLKPLPNIATYAIPKIKPIDNTLVKPIASIKPLTMPKPIVNTLKPLPTPNLAISAIPKIKPIDNSLIKPIPSIKPVMMPKPVINALRPMQTPSFVKYTIPTITPMGKVMVKPIENFKPITMPKPIATNIKSMPAPKFAHIDIPSLNYMSKKFNFEMPQQLDAITMPKVTPIKITPIRMPDVEIPRYTMPNIAVMEIPRYTMPKIAVTEIKYQPINKQFVEKTIKLYDAKVMRDASRINSMISPSNNLQKYFSGRNELKIDLAKFIQIAPVQRKEIINQAQIYANSVEVKKLEALDTWRNEYDKFLALSSNISNVVKETGEVDPASLDYLENVKENLDMLTRNITDMGIDKAAMQQVIKNSGETVINPLMKEKVPMPSTLENPSLRVLPGSNIAPKVDIINGISSGISNIFTSTVHAEEQ